MRLYIKTKLFSNLREIQKYNSYIIKCYINLFKYEIYVRSSLYYKRFNADVEYFWEKEHATAQLPS